MQSQKEWIPFTYLIGWSKLDIWYYGSKYSKDAHPDLLWNPYKTSSKIVEKFIEENGEPDIIQVRKLFKTVKETRHFESNVIRRMNAVKSKNWLNKSEGNGDFYNTGEKWNNDPEYQKYFKEVCNTSEHKEKLRINNEKQFSDPFLKEKHRLACMEVQPAELRSKQTKALWEMMIIVIVLSRP